MLEIFAKIVVMKFMFNTFTLSYKLSHNQVDGKV